LSTGKTPRKPPGLGRKVGGDFKTGLGRRDAVLKPTPPTEGQREIKKAKRAKIAKTEVLDRSAFNNGVKETRENRDYGMGGIRLGFHLFIPFVLYSFPDPA
jgi:hypothetical protein